MISTTNLVRFDCLDIGYIFIVEQCYPVNTTQIKSFVSACRWFGKFILDLSKIAEPLNTLLRKNVPYNFSEKCKRAFNELKQTL